jgi:2-hydroxychromene-2-carboxylate isomerase
LDRSMAATSAAHRPASIDFFFDPVCPFAWLTSRWVLQVADQRPLTVNWRFISLHLVNARDDHAGDNPYAALHLAGRSLLRVAAALRGAAASPTEGNELVGRYYTALGEHLWYRRPGPGEPPLAAAGDPHLVPTVLGALGVDKELSTAASDTSFDDVIASETDVALDRAGTDVGTPICTFDPPRGPSVFGPVISTLPDAGGALQLWDAVNTLAAHGGFSELKRSGGDLPDLPALEALRAGG